MTPAPPVRLLGAALLTLWWEHIWSRLWPALALAGGFIGLALLDVLPWLPGWLHLGLLAAWAIALGIALFKGIRGFPRPTRAMALTRLERDSRLDHCLLASLEDRLAVGDAAVWLEHRRRNRLAAAGLRLALPSPGIAGKDRFALRTPALLLLVAGIIVGHGAVGERLVRALTPQVFPPGPMPFVDVWITPPAHTGRPELHLGVDGRAEPAITPLRPPRGSRLLAQVTGAGSPPWLDLNGKRKEFSAIGADSFRIEALLDAETRLEIGIGRRTVAAWPLAIEPDRPPLVAFTQGPEDAGKGRLRFGWRANDDYGLKALDLVLVRGDDQRRHPLPFAAGKPDVTGSAMPDFSAHVWSGSDVDLFLEALDGAGQSGRGPLVSLQLPRRIFSHPVAELLAQSRIELADATAEARESVASRLYRLSEEPLRYDHDLVVHLGLRVGAGRLLWGRDRGAVEEVRNLLWSLALRLEDGGVGLVGAEVERLTEALRRAIEQGASPAELENLAARLQAALGQLFQSLAGQAIKGLKLEAGDLTLSRDILDDLVKEAMEMALAGDPAGAAELLSRLERMARETASGIPDAGTRREMAEMAGLLKDIRRLEREQTDLMDQTFTAARERRDRDQDSRTTSLPVSDPDPDRQESLAGETSSLATAAGKRPGGLSEDLGAAAAAMERAAEFMNLNRHSMAVDEQKEAILSLNRAGDELTRSLMQMARGGVMSLGRGDPFGRSPTSGSGPLADDGTRLPGRTERRRVRELMDELRRRAADTTRRPEERSYLERLLRRF